MVQLLISKAQQQQIEWRRDRVLELSSQGFTQSDIATMLQVDKSIISRDLGYLRQQAQENLQKHIHETIPEDTEAEAEDNGLSNNFEREEEQQQQTHNGIF
jgi:transcriptional regulator